jgi:hypothetical protein
MKSPNCRLLTAWQAIVKALTVTRRNGPSPSSGKRLSADPIVNLPSISGLQRRPTAVPFGAMLRHAVSLETIRRSSRVPAQQWCVVSDISDSATLNRAP